MVKTDSITGKKLKSPAGRSIVYLKGGDDNIQTGKAAFIRIGKEGRLSKEPCPVDFDRADPRFSFYQSGAGLVNFQRRSGGRKRYYETI